MTDSQAALSEQDINFRPYTVVLGVILGTLFSIAFGLAIVVLVFWILQAESPRLQAEMPLLLQSTGIFIGLTALAAAAFLGSLRLAKWRYWPMGLLWLSLLIVGRHYWPD